MTFEPTFDDLESKSAELPDVSGAFADVDGSDVDRDLAGDSDTAGDQEAIGGGEADAAAAAGDEVTADDLPPLGP
jgi:hypothetical protein